MLGWPCPGWERVKKPVGESIVVRPTERELEVLEVLWRLGPSTVREVVDALDGGHGAGYTSWQKIMTIMLEKGLVSRTAAGRGHRYAARVAQGEVRRRLAGELLERVDRKRTRLHSSHVANSYA